MKTSSAKAKGRRLQVQVAEVLARAFSLSILAEKPTKPGKRNGAWWIGESELFPTQAAVDLALPDGSDHWTPDLRVRLMGHPGADVALLTARARERVAHQRRPLSIECKNVEAWGLGREFWLGEVPALVRAGYEQARKQCVAGVLSSLAALPLLVVGRNRWPPVAVCDWLSLEELGFERGPIAVLGEKGTLLAVPLARLLILLDGAR